MKFSLIVSALFLSIALFSQTAEDERLAIQFFQLREYEKAEILFQKLYKSNTVKYFDYLFKSFIYLKKFDEAILLAKDNLKGSQSNNLDFRFKLGYAYYKKNDSNNAKKEWEKTNQNITENEYQITTLIAQYSELRQWGYIEDVIHRFHQKTKNQNSLNNYLLDAYLYQRKYNEAVELTVDILEKENLNYMAALSSFQYLNDNEEAIRLMEKKVFSKLSKDPNSDKWNEIAMWLSISIKDYEQALSLAKSFEKRKNGIGQQVLQISEVALSEGEYQVAIDGYSYLSKSSNNGFAKLGQEKKIKTIYQKIEDKPIVDSSWLKLLKESFVEYYLKYNKDYTTAEIQLVEAEYKMKYMNQIDSAIRMLQSVIILPNINGYISSKAKILLADILMVKNEIWESSLLYGQVDKEEKDSPLGEIARFKNAKVFYYNGDYELASDLLTILKSSTTELISNDALYLATFIQDNLDGDTLEMAMQDVSKAELLFYQNKPLEAFKVLNSVKKIFPTTNLMDDILLIEANYALKTGNISEASNRFKELYENHPNSVIADRALYEWSKIEEISNNNSNAMEGYLKILTKYKDSVYSKDSRKRLRKLRGENLEI